MRGNRHATRDALLHYMQVDTQPVALYAIKRYLFVMHHVKPGAVRECLRRLLKAGVITHPQRGYYQWGNDANA